jgi:hypothetical protein
MEKEIEDIVEESVPQLDPFAPVLLEPVDPLDRGRHVFRKGRFEWMGGPVFYEQGANGYGFENNNRKVNRTYPMNFDGDEIAIELGSDVTEQ